MTATCAFARLCCPLGPHYPHVDPAGVPILFQGYALYSLYFIFPSPSSVNLLHLLVAFPSPVWSLLFRSLLFVDLWPSSVSSGFKGTAGPWHCLILPSYGIASCFVSSPSPRPRAHIYWTRPALSSCFCCFCLLSPWRAFKMTGLSILGIHTQWIFVGWVHEYQWNVWHCSQCWLKRFEWKGQ